MHVGFIQEEKKLENKGQLLQAKNASMIKSYSVLKEVRKGRSRLIAVLQLFKECLDSEWNFFFARSKIHTVKQAYIGDVHKPWHQKWPLLASKCW